jgi:predicted acylesterase/phospholipase RssA
MADAADTEEVRVAMALNGGVSLAVWMGGCGVELYRALCQAFRQELVIDLMSGASAGGINGALLGAAIRRGSRLDPDFIRGKWLSLGDFERLLHPTSNVTPRSLMQGKRFADELTDTFEELVGTTKRDPRTIVNPPPPALDVKLTVTTTNLVGEPVSFLDVWDGELQAREHRGQFHFHKDADFQVQLLAQASRCSASFPLAFEPFAVTDGALRELAGFAEDRWVVDGGLLDNAPIAAVLDLIPTRRAEREVRRFVVYVNADAAIPPPPPPEPDPEGPTLVKIVGNAINLPRTAPFVEQLYAIKRATERAEASSDDPPIALLRVDLPCTEATAQALLPAYRRQRFQQSLEDVLGDPAEAGRRLDDYGEHGVELPWIPRSLAPLGPDGRWQWGVHAALRALYLLNDALRPSLKAARVDQRRRLLQARTAVYDQVARIQRDYDRALEAAERRLGPIGRTEWAVAQVDPREAIGLALDAVAEVSDLLADGIATGLFGDGTDRHAWFLRRALALEVVRRALNARETFDTAQHLRFAQLTPFSPGWLFTSTPWASDGTCTPETKLLGLRLGHFAGFYRRSWRANDFMWGRMDAAARIVDMLVSGQRARQLRDDGVAEKPWDILAAALTPAGDDVAAQLVTEALGTAPAEYPSDLAAAIEYDLTTAGTGCKLTRILCTRAAQLEAFRHEYPVLEQEAAADWALGGGSRPLGLGAGDAAAIASLRQGDPLPQRLAAGDEAGSRLAVQTATHAALVALGALRTAGPAGRPLFALRAFVLPVAGSVARSWVNRLAVVVAFWSAALFLAGRTLQPPGAADLNGAWTASLVVALFAALTVAGVVALPALRAWLAARAKLGTWAPHALWAVGLALVGFGAIFAALLGGVSVTDIVAAPAAEEVNTVALGVVLAVVLGSPIAGIPALANTWLGKVLKAPWGGWLALPLAAGASLVVGVLSVGWVWDAIGDSWWQTVGALLAFLAGPVLALRAWKAH